MSVREWHCQDPACDQRGVQATPGSLRKFCSERCRKRQYDRACVHCGGRVSGTDPGKQGAEPVCATCAPAHYRTWDRNRVLEFILRWAAEHDGRAPSVNAVRRARHHGATDIPSIETVKGYFGSWNAAIAAAGLPTSGPGDRATGPHLTKARRRECARRYAAGESSTQIAADLGCSPAIVLRWARAHGCDIRPSFSDRAVA